MRDRPADLGLPAYGETAVTPPPPAARRPATLLTSPLADAQGSVAQPRPSGSCSPPSSSAALSTNGLIQTHFISLCGDYGIAPVAAASVLAVMGVFDFFGTIGSGWLSDRYDNRWLLFWYYGLRGLSLLYLPFSHFSLLRPVDLRRLLRPRLDRDRAADGEDRRPTASAARRPTSSSAGSSPAISSAPPPRPSAPACRAPSCDSYLPAFFVAGALCLLAAILAVTLRKPA